MRPKKIIQLCDHYNFYSSAIFVIRNTVAKIRKCAIERNRTIFAFKRLLDQQFFYFSNDKKKSVDFFPFKCNM